MHIEARKFNCVVSYFVHVECQVAVDGEIFSFQ